MNPDREIGPAEVAAELGITIARARRYMKAGALRSFVGTSAKDGRKYLRTFASELERYRRGRLASRDTSTEPPISSATIASSAIRFDDIWN